MPDPDLLMAFLAATLVFALMPGPGMLYSAARTLSEGRRAGVLAALGLHIGGYAHVAAAALGLAILFELVPVLYMALKLAGAAYLIWLGLQLLCSGFPAKTGDASLTPTGRRAFWQSVAVEVLNPKTALFYLAFLPQFTDPAAAFPVWLQLAVLGIAVNAMFSCGDLISVLLADRVTRTIQRSRTAMLWVRRLGASLLIGLGIKLAIGRT